ncbi:hypothetical protein [Nocardia niwae]|uniref:hypothetical protein n=1 Tax=Nocardia niwae TaxID=626084 RepID=UPI0007A372DE|nr:hypothetical protein [Nocardia niwae]
MDADDALQQLFAGLGRRAVYATEDGGLCFYWPDTANQLSIEAEPDGALYIHVADVNVGTFSAISVPAVVAEPKEDQ